MNVKVSSLVRHIFSALGGLFVTYLYIVLSRTSRLVYQ